MPVPTYFLKVDGVEIPVARGSATRGTPERSGESSRAYDNTYRSSVDPTQQKRVWSIATPALKTAVWNAIEAVLVEGDEHTADGAMIDRTGAHAATVQVELGDVAFIADGDDDFQYTANVVLREV